MDEIAVVTEVPGVSTDRLWALVGDLAAWGEMLPTVDSVQRLDGGGAVGVGARFAVRQPGLPAAVYEVTEWSPGRSFTWVARSPGVVTAARHAIAPVGDDARLSLSVGWTGPLAGPVRFLLAGKARRMVESEAATFARLARRA